jgi:ribosomal protein L39E
MPINEPIELKLRIKKSSQQERETPVYMKNHPTRGTAEVVMEAGTGP